MPALHHALLGASAVALAFAGLRVASRLAESGLPRLLAAAAFATAAAVAEALLLALVSLGGSSAALTVAALATAVAALAWLPRPALPLGDEIGRWWRVRGPAERAVLGAVGGAGLAWAAWQLEYPALGYDTIHYHLPEMVMFVQGGRPGSVNDVLPGLPVGNYPLTTEVTIAWGMGIARSLVPLVLWPWVTLALAATAAWGGLRSLGVTRLAAGVAAAALCTNPWLLAWQSNGSITDPPALAWLVVCAALTVMSRSARGLLAPAVIAGALGIGCKTTVLPYALVVLALGLWSAVRAKEIPVRALALATVAAAVVGGFWYLRNLVTHGSPFWPLVAAPWGDPLPHSVQLVKTSFLDAPRATIDALHHEYLNRFGGALIALAGALLAPLAAQSRRVVFAAVAVLVGLLVWASAPVTGIAPGVALPEAVFSTTRYALPVVAAACLALALAATDARRRVLRAAALLVLCTAVVVNLVLTIRLHFPVAPSARTPLAGAALGAALAAAFRPRHLRLPAWLAPALGVAAAALLAIPASGFVERHGDTHFASLSIAVSWMAREPLYRDGDSPVATTPAFIGALAGDRLQHKLVAIPDSAGCAQLAARAGHQWLVVYGGRLGGLAPATVKRCLPSPALDAGLLVYRPG